MAVHAPRLAHSAAQRSFDHQPLIDRVDCIGIIILIFILIFIFIVIVVVVVITGQ